MQAVDIKDLGMYTFSFSVFFSVLVASFMGGLKPTNSLTGSLHFTNVNCSGVTGGFQSGLNYQRLEEECWQSEPNLATEFGSAGFVREKKVDLEEDGDEHVLYVQ